MADLGETSGANSSTASGGPGHKTSSWITVGLVVIGTVLLGLAMVLQSLPLAIVGGVVVVLGGVYGLATGIMDDVH